jgi:biopolymer transport protein TolQ
MTADNPARFPSIAIYTKDWWTTTMAWTLALYLFQEDPTTAAPAAANGSALLEMIHNSGPVAFAVLIILLIASIFSWTIMISKWSRFGRAQTQSARFIRAFRKSTRLSEIAAVADQFKPSPLVAVFGEIHDE